MYTLGVFLNMMIEDVLQPRPRPKADEPLTQGSEINTYANVIAFGKHCKSTVFPLVVTCDELPVVNGQYILIHRLKALATSVILNTFSDRAWPLELHTLPTFSLEKVRTMHGASSGLRFPAPIVKCQVQPEIMMSAR